MATSDILPWATGAGGATVNATSQAAYAALATSILATGVQPGQASSAIFNKAMRQALFMAAGFAQFMVNESINVPDDANLSALAANIASAVITAASTGGFSYKSVSSYGTNQTFTLAQASQLAYNTAAISFTLPVSSTVKAGTPITTFAYGGALTVNSQGGDNLVYATAVGSGTTTTTTLALVQSDYVTWISNGAGLWIAQNVPVLTVLSGNYTTNANLASNYVAQSQFTGANQSISGTSGYQKLPGGLILQWARSASNSGTTWTFPLAFPNEIFGFYGTPYTSASGTVSVTADATGTRLTQATYSWTANSGGYLFAIGK